MRWIRQLVREFRTVPIATQSATIQSTPVGRTTPATIEAAKRAYVRGIERERESV